MSDEKRPMQSISMGNANIQIKINLDFEVFNEQDAFHQAIYLTTTFLGRLIEKPENSVENVNATMKRIMPDISEELKKEIVKSIWGLNNPRH